MNFYHNQKACVQLSFSLDNDYLIVSANSCLVIQCDLCDSLYQWLKLTTRVTIHFFFSLKITDWQQLLMAYHFTSVNSLCVIIQCVVKINIFSFNIIINQTVIEKQRRRKKLLYWFKTFHWWFAFILFALKWSSWRKYNIYCHLVVGDTPYMHGEEKEIYVLFFS